LIAAQSESANPIAKPAAILLMFGHGVTIAMLFGLADRIERLTGTLELRDLGGLAKQAPKLAFLFGLAAMASIGLPGLANFAGEVMVFIAGFKGWKPDTPPGWVQIATILSLWGLVISAVYMLRAFRQIFQGPAVELTRNASDLSARDRSPAILLAAVLLIVGLFPNILLQFLEQPEDEPVVAREQAHITQHPRPPQPAGSAPVQPHPSPSQ